MNKKFIYFLLGTRFQDFMAAALSFGILLIFYDLTGSVLSSGTLTACSIIVSRIIMFFLIPILKIKSPIEVSSTMSMIMAGAAFLAMFGSHIWSTQISFYISITVTFSVIQELSRSFNSSILPRIIEKEQLFKYNSINAILFNISQIAAPMCGYLFKAANIQFIFLVYFAMASFSSLMMFVLYRSVPKIESFENKVTTGSKMRFFSEAWVKTFQMVLTNPNMLFCIAIGVSINILFAGMNGPFLLKMGGNHLGATVIKVCLSVGSLLGVYGAIVLNVKDKYEKYLRVSVYGAMFTLVVLIFLSNPYVFMLGMVALMLFVMFIMNTTGTFLQIVTPLEELPAVYEIRSTIYSIVVPISYLAIGWLLEHWSYRVYFGIAVLIIWVTWNLKGIGSSPLMQNKQFESVPEKRQHRRY